MSDTNSTPTVISATQKQGDPRTYTFVVLHEETPLIEGYTFAWNFGDGATSELPQPEHTFADAGDYAIQVAINPKEGKPDDEGGNADEKEPARNPPGLELQVV